MRSNIPVILILLVGILFIYFAIPDNFGSERLLSQIESLRRELHSDGSGDRAKKMIDDLEVVYVDEGTRNPDTPKEIIPFTYYYSKKMDATIGICNTNKTVFICLGRKDKLLETADFKDCQIQLGYIMALDNLRPFYQ